MILEKIFPFFFIKYDEMIFGNHQFNKIRCISIITGEVYMCILSQSFIEMVSPFTDKFRRICVTILQIKTSTAYAQINLRTAYILIYSPFLNTSVLHILCYGSSTSVVVLCSVFLGMVCNATVCYSI